MFIEEVTQRHKEFLGVLELSVVQCLAYVFDNHGTDDPQKAMQSSREIMSRSSLKAVCYL